MQNKIAKSKEARKIAMLAMSNDIFVLAMVSWQEKYCSRLIIV